MGYDGVGGREGNVDDKRQPPLTLVRTPSHGAVSHEPPSRGKGHLYLLTRFGVGDQEYLLEVYRNSVGGAAWVFMMDWQLIHWLTLGTVGIA